jgi:glycosyltransferase involved in cell wall biosynthesis
MKKTILFISYSNITDPIIHSQGLPLLKSLAGEGYTCSFISSEKSNENSDIKNRIYNKYSCCITFYSFKLKSSKFIPNWIFSFYLKALQVKKIIEEKNISILHCRSLFPGIIALIVKIFYKKRIKIIYDNRGVYIDEKIYKGHWNANGIKEIVTRKLEKLLIKKCTAQVVVSNYFKSYIIEKNLQYTTNIKEKTFVITNGTKIDESRIFIEKDRSRITGVFVGSAAKWQNLDGVINLIKISQNINKSLYFKIISYNIEVFENAIKQSGLDNSRIELMHVESHKIQAIIASSSFGVLLREDNLINNVASPLKFAEYLSAGLPILISKGIGDTEEVIKKYNIGVIVENEFYEEGLKSMIELLKDEDIHNRCIHIAKKEFNINNNFEKYKMLYNKIVDDKL